MFFTKYEITYLLTKVARKLSKESLTIDTASTYRPDCLLVLLHNSH